LLREGALIRRVGKQLAAVIPIQLASGIVQASGGLPVFGGARLRAQRGFHPRGPLVRQQ